MKVKEMSKKVGLKLNIQKLRSWHPVPSLHDEAKGKNGNSDRLSMGSKITADGDCGHEIKGCLLLGRKAMTSLDNIKSRDITLLTKIHLVKAVVFPVVTYRCESWTIKKADHQRADAFKLWAEEDS